LDNSQLKVTDRRTKPSPKVTKPVTKQRGLSTKTLSRILNKTKDLTDLAYEDYTHATGFRVALWLLRAYACAPIDKPLALSPQRLSALLAYLDRCDKHAERMASQRTRPAQSSPQEFLQQTRTSVTNLTSLVASPDTGPSARDVGPGDPPAPRS
jgi:hypothetical protein